MEYYFGKVNKLFPVAMGLLSVLCAIIAIALPNSKFSFRSVTLRAVAIIVIISTFLKSIIDVDRSFDTWLYHLPFAARIWGIVPETSYIFEDFIQGRFDGFPLLGEFLQGFFWFTFQHIQAANLVSFLSLVLCVYFLKIYFQIPLYLSVIALLAVPLIQIHCTTCYVDLPGSIFFSILIMMTYLLYIQKDFFTKRNLFIMFAAAACAANIKFQLVPVVFLTLCFIVFKVIKLGLKQIHEKKLIGKRLMAILFTAFLATFLIFARPLRNTIVYKNPFYPVRIEVMGKVLNYKEGFYQDAFTFGEKDSTPKRWLYSIFEITNPPFRWSIDQYSKNPNENEMGGFSVIYVIFNILLLLYICLRYRSREALFAVILVIIMSAATSICPHSHELRYSIYWMIVLISLNLYLALRLNQSMGELKAINVENIGVVCLLMLALVVAATKARYVRPMFYTLKVHMQKKVKLDILKKIHEGDEVCIVGKRPYTFLYASEFHPPSQYSLKAADHASECGTRKVIK